MRRKTKPSSVVPCLDRKRWRWLQRRHSFASRVFTSRRLMLSYAHRATLGTEE